MEVWRVGRGKKIKNERHLFSVKFNCTFAPLFVILSESVRSTTSKVSTFFAVAYPRRAGSSLQDDNVEYTKN
jgi:hypothetical protein